MGCGVSKNINNEQKKTYVNDLLFNIHPLFIICENVNISNQNKVDYNEIKKILILALNNHEQYIEYNRVGDKYNFISDYHIRKLFNNHNIQKVDIDNVIYLFNRACEKI
jgi:hypothetical protein